MRDVHSPQPSQDRACQYNPLAQREIEEIVAIDDPALRNLLITHGYYNLKLGMAELLGSENVNWCAFAMWASRTAGRFIRGEFLPRFVRRLDRGVIRRSRLRSFIELMTRQISRHVSEGNRMVFADIAPVYARMIAEFRGATRYDREAIDRFVATLRPGRVDSGGEDLLASAFRAYHEAMFETDPKKKAELIFLANSQVGLHEQTRLQASINDALFAPLTSFAGRSAPRLIRGPAARLVSPVYARMKREWAVLTTLWFMRLDLPNHSICLGKDLPQHCEDQMFPSQLAEIENPDLRALLGELDFTPDTTQGSAAKNWADLSERMNFLVDLFRTRQQDRTLFEEPFSAEEAAAVLE